MDCTKVIYAFPMRTANLHSSQTYNYLLHNYNYLSTIMQQSELLFPKVHNIKWRVMTSQILTFYGSPTVAWCARLKTQTDTGGRPCSLYPDLNVTTDDSSIVGICNWSEFLDSAKTFRDDSWFLKALTLGAFTTSAGKLGNEFHLETTDCKSVFAHIQMRL